MGETGKRLFSCELGCIGPEGEKKLDIQKAHESQYGTHGLLTAHIKEEF